MAMLSTFIESGSRLGEVAGLKLEDVDFEEEVVYVVGKGRRPRRVAFGPRPARPWTSTCGSVPAIPMRARRRCGSGPRDPYKSTVRSQ